jgi:hypothetical protein
MGFYNIVNAPSLVAGQPEDIAQVLANFQAIQAVLNGGIDDVNVRSTAAINPSKFLGYPSDPTQALFGDGLWKKQGLAVLYDSVVAGVVFPVASITTALDQTYKHLLCAWGGRTTSGALDNLLLRFNGVATANYYWQNIQGLAGTAAAGGSGGLATAIAIGFLTQSNGFDASGAFFVPNYSGATGYKPAVGINFAQASATPTFVVAGAGGVFNATTGPITSLTLLPATGPNFNNGRFTVYGMN